MILTKISVLSGNLRKQLKLIYLQDKIVLILFFLSLFLNLVLYLILAVWLRPVADPIILHYTVYFGIDYLGAWYNLYTMPAVGTFIGLVNFGLLFFFYRREIMVGYFLSGVTLLVQALLLIGGSLLLWINI